jgi:hypothetical protein
VVSHQVSRAAAQFAVRSIERAMTTLTGALYLVRRGELTPSMLGRDGAEAFRFACREFSSRGDAGRARALYEVLSRIGTDSERRDAQSHLDAVVAWTRSPLASGPPMQSAGALERVAVRRRLLEASDAATQDALVTSLDWFKRALVVRGQFQQTRRPPDRDEGAEAYRALQTGPAILLAIPLLSADAEGALASLDRAGARQLAPSELVQALEAVVEVEAPDASRWADLFRALRPLATSRGDDDFGPDRDLFRTATFSVALEAYRLDPSVPELAGTVASALTELGMAEAVPAVLTESVRAHQDPRTVGGALALTLQAMAMEADADDITAARRVFRAAEPLLAMADTKALAGRLQPTSGRVRAKQGELELREGNVDAARGLLRSAVVGEKAGIILALLARIEWHDQDTVAAEQHLHEALDARDAVMDRGLRADIGLLLADIALEKGNVDLARRALTEALRDTTQALRGPDPRGRPGALRTAARIFDRFGDDVRAQGALELSLAASLGDKRQAGQTLEQMVGRALVRSDLAAAHDTFTRALAMELDREDRVYMALWVRLLERQHRARLDPAADRIFVEAKDDARWIGRLASFGAGKLAARDLLSAAKNASEVTEALFYGAMARRGLEPRESEEGLRQVLRAGGVQLMETGFAREILAGPRGRVGAVPADVIFP